MDETSIESVENTHQNALPTREDLLQRARNMVPTLIERAHKCEEMARAPDETIEDFREAGFFKIGVPKTYGGYEMDYDILCEVIMEIAHGCASSAWNLAVLGEHAYTITNSSREILDELWGEGPNVLIATGNDPKAELKPVEGGYIFNARTSFSSGCDHVTSWISRGTDTETGEKVGVLIPKQENVRIIEGSWQVSGLAGSGSKDIEFKNIFFP